MAGGLPFFVLFAFIVLPVSPLPAQRDFAHDDAYTANELCIKSCNRGHDICMESSSARLENYGEPRHVVGAAAACDRALRACLRRCATTLPDGHPTAPGRAGSSP